MDFRRGRPRFLRVDDALLGKLIRDRRFHALVL